MIVAKKLNMDRPTAEAALEYLTKYNILIYFPRYQNDTVFVDVNLFSKILSGLYYKNCNKHGWHAAIFDRHDIDEVTSQFTERHLTSNDYITLLEKLMILGQLDSSTYLMSCMLVPLSPTHIKSLQSAIFPKQVLLKCPSVGYEFMSMLVSFLLNQSWTIFQFQSGNPESLHKNCVKFYAKTFQCPVTVSFSEQYLSIFAESEVSSSKFNEIFTFVLSGLEKVKIILNCHKSFDFEVAFPCRCGIRKLHTATHDVVTNKLICDVSNSLVLPQDYQSEIIVRSESKGMFIIDAAKIAICCSSSSDLAGPLGL